MQVLVRPELPTASVGSSQATTAAVDNSAPLATRPQSTYKSGNVVQTSGATSVRTGQKNKAEYGQCESDKANPAAVQDAPAQGEHEQRRY